MAIPLIGAIASVGSALIGAYASSQAAKAQAKATRYAADITRKNYQDTQALLQPQIAAGDTARRYQLGALGLPGEVGNSEVMSAFRTSPGYEFARDQGMNAVQTSAAAGGSFFSGRTLKRLQEYGQNLADSEFGTWFDRLVGVAGGGATATNRMVDAGEGTARTLSGLALEGGDARASSYTGLANAGIGGLQNLSDLYAYYNPPASRMAAPIPRPNPMRL